MRIQRPARDRCRRAVGGLLFGAAVSLCCMADAHAQTSADLQQILQRLDRLEQQNRELLDKVHTLEQELAAAREASPTASAAPTPTLEDRIAVQENRVEELSQTKVEASSRFPIRVTGMALFNTFLNSRTSGDTEYPTTAAPYGVSSAGATLRQTTIGLEYAGSQTVGGGKVRGSLFIDFFGGSLRALDQTVRLRTAIIGVDWASRSVEVGIEKPLISPRDPSSLAQVGVSPLTGAGNLWLWIPQIRVEQKLKLGERTALRAQIAAVQTSEDLPSNSGAISGYAADAAPSPPYEGRRPGIEGRLEFSHGEGRRIEIAPAFHRSVTHVAGTSAPSNIFSLDWLARPASPIEFTGAFFTGQNVAVLGTGAYRQGFTIPRSGYVEPVHSRGGWAQVTLHATPRLSFHIFSGQQDDRNSDLVPGSIGKNLVYGANFFYRLAPNVQATFETTQTRTNYVGRASLLNNHYDLGLAYLF